MAIFPCFVINLSKKLVFYQKLKIYIYLSTGPQTSYFLCLSGLFVLFIIKYSGRAEILYTILIGIIINKEVLVRLVN